MLGKSVFVLQLCQYDFTRIEKYRTSRCMFTSLLLISSRLLNCRVFEQFYHTTFYHTWLDLHTFVLSKTRKYN